MRSKLIGIGSALPAKIFKNSEFSENLNTSDEWIVKRTGIQQRYICVNETTSSLAFEASIEAIENAKIDKSEIDLIIVATVTGDKTFPSTASILQGMLEIKHGAAFDIGATCSGFVYAIDMADAYIKSGKFKCVLVVGAESFSKILNWEDRGTCVLFGDGAGAVILKATETDNIGIQYSKIYSDGKYCEMLKTSGGVGTTKNAGFVEMSGSEVFKFAADAFYDSLIELMQRTNLKLEDIDYIIPHQANIRIIDKLIERTGIDKSKVIVSIGEHANTSAASIPLALNTCKDKIFKSKNIVLISMGAGFTWGATMIKMN